MENMKQKDQTEPSNKELHDEIVKLNDTVVRLSKGYPHASTFLRNIGFFFLRGVVMGLGWLVAFVILIPILVLILRMFTPTPIVGDVIDNVVDRIMEYQRPAEFPTQ